MRIENVFYAVIAMAGIVFLGVEFHTTFVNDYQPHTGAPDMMVASNISQGQYSHLLEQTNETTFNTTSTLEQGLSNVPVMGGTLVQVFNVFQIVQATVKTLLTAMDMGTNLVSSVSLLIGFELPSILTFILNQVIIIAILFALIAMVLKWRG